MTYRYGATNVLYPFGYGLSYTSFSYSGLTVHGQSGPNHSRGGDSAAATAAAAAEVGGAPLQGNAVAKHPTLPTVSTLGPCETLNLTVTVENTGTTDSSEVVQVYLQWDAAATAAAGTPTPLLQLVDFDKVHVPAGGKVVVTLSIPPRQFAVLSGASTNSSLFLDPLSTRSNGSVTGDGSGGANNGSSGGDSGGGGGRAKPAMPVWVVAPQTFAVWVGGQQPSLAGAATGARAPSNVLQSSFIVQGPANTPLDACGGGSPS